MLFPALKRTSVTLASFNYGIRHYAAYIMDTFFRKKKTNMATTAFKKRISTVRNCMLSDMPEFTRYGYMPVLLHIQQNAMVSCTALCNHNNNRFKRH